MVHVEDAPVTRRAVMAAFRLENVAHEAVSAAFVFRISQVEAPEDGHLAWIRSHSLDERPYKHEKKEVEHA